MTNSSQENDFCLSSTNSRYIFSAWFTLYLLFLPLFLFVIFIFFTKWRKQRFSSSATISHSDVFTLNMVTMELTSLVGSVVACYGLHSWVAQAWNTGGDVIANTSIGQMFFHSLTCIDRYLAVVHPVTYMRLKTGGAITIRNISIGIVWIISITFTLAFRLLGNLELFYKISALILAILPVPIVVFCSVSVLCVLIRPKPGDRKQVDQSKRSTFYTMVGIVGVLLLRLIVSVVINSIIITEIDGCVLTITALWSTLPSSLVLPLLFLNRAGNLPQCK